MDYHSDKEVEKAMIRLMDALCSWERNTFRGSTLIFVPDTIDEHEKIIFAQDGKPMPTDPFLLTAILEGLKTRIQSSDPSSQRSET